MGIHIFNLCSEGKNSKLNKNVKNEKYAQILLFFCDLRVTLGFNISIVNDWNSIKIWQDFFLAVYNIVKQFHVKWIKAEISIELRKSKIKRAVKLSKKPNVQENSMILKCHRTE